MKEKIYYLLDKLMNIIVISLILIVGSLPIITMLPTFAALLGTIYFFDKENDWASYPAAFVYYFKKFFKQSFLCQLLLMTVLLIGKINLSLLDTLPTGLKLAVYAITLFFSGLIILLVFSSIFSLLIYPNELFLERIKISLVITIIKLPYSFLLLFVFFSGISIIVLVPQAIIIVLGCMFSLYIMIEKNIWKEFKHQKIS